MSAAGTILIVDDNPTILAVLDTRLRAAGYVVASCATGTAALERVRLGDIGLMLLDLVMPDLSGIDVLGRLRGDPATSRLPVIVITGRSDPSAAVEAIAAGADDWIAKPFAFAALRLRIERLLAHRSHQIGAAATTTHAPLLASIQALQHAALDLSRP